MCGAKVTTIVLDSPVATQEQEFVCYLPQGHEGAHNGVVTREVTMTWTGGR